MTPIPTPTPTQTVPPPPASESLTKIAQQRIAELQAEIDAQERAELEQFEIEVRQFCLRRGFIIDAAPILAENPTTRRFEIDAQVVIRRAARVK